MRSVTPPSPSINREEVEIEARKLDCVEEVVVIVSEEVVAVAPEDVAARESAEAEATPGEARLTAFVSTVDEERRRRAVTTEGKLWTAPEGPSTSPPEGPSTSRPEGCEPAVLPSMNYDCDFRPATDSTMVSISRPESRPSYGFALASLEDGSKIVSSVARGGLSEGKVSAGDTIAAINGRMACNLSHKEALAEITSGTHLNLNVVVNGLWHSGKLSL
jgi:hypothetical protein